MKETNLELKGNPKSKKMHHVGKDKMIDLSKQDQLIKTVREHNLSINKNYADIERLRKAQEMKEEWVQKTVHQEIMNNARQNNATCDYVYMHLKRVYFCLVMLAFAQVITNILRLFA